jgi:lipopolysaccharide transport system ATP-binding protein
MKNETVISIKNIGKKYNITHQQGGYVALRDVLTNILKSPFAFLKQKTKEVAGIAKKEEFWALRDINFEVKKGEVIGIIGRNGAGKSTLLKILSQITPPTEGEIKINGRVGSLLEVGTGFHPELSGRENIFLNGAILGMTKKEIASKFDEIVAFSGIEKFLDTPVKRYSSGMHVRLAFSVAAHMDPDILIIDEVLAVGDAEFQKKCLGKMDEITKKEGRTIIFVSHNMEAIKKLCSRCIVLNKGEKVFESDTEKALIAYSNIQNDGKLITNKGIFNKNRRGSGALSFTNIEILDTNNKDRNIFNVGETVKFKMSYEIYDDMQGLYVFISLNSSKTKELLTSVKHEIKKGDVKKNESGSVVIEVELNSICPGEYTLYFWLGDDDATGQSGPINYDVVDGMIGPLIVKPADEKGEATAGYFTLKSKIEILK